MKKIFFVLFMVINFASQAQQMPLYKKNVPNSLPVKNKESIEKKTNIILVTKVSVPAITMFRPAKPNGRAVIICPGGAYAVLAWDIEGTKVAMKLNKLGITAFVLKHRLPDDSANINKSLAPLQDAQQAIRMVRSNASRWGIDPAKIGIMGFSAGGHLASTAATHYSYKADPGNADTTSARPDFAILIYPVISFDKSITNEGSRNNLVGEHPTDSVIHFFSNELHVDPATPPTFLIHAGDDDAVVVENSIRFYQACIKNKVPAEMHLYPKGGHGFGMYNKTTNDSWVDRLKNWLAILDKK